MKSKIIIHNETGLSDAEALLYAWKALREEYVEKAELYTAEFQSGVRVQKVKRDKGSTLYVYK
jgi:hypothetical protein